MQTKLTLFDLIAMEKLDAVWDRIASNPEQMLLTDMHGSTPIHYVASKDMPELIKLFIEKGIDINSENISGTTALFLAASAGKLETVRCLLRLGADINQPNHNYATPLFMAARNGHHAVVETLLRAGADSYIANIHGVSPYDIALAQGHQTIAAVIIKLAHLYDGAPRNEDNIISFQQFVSTHTGKVVND